jgi:hypothetical protein
MAAKTLSLFAMLAVLFVGAMTMLRAQVIRPGGTLQLWEYHTEIVRSQGTGAMERGEGPRRGTGSPDAVLNSLGSDGWELVGVQRREIRVENVMQTETMYAFKRPTRSINR